MKYQVKINTRDYTVDVGEIKAGFVQVVVNGVPYDVQIEMPAMPSARSMPAAPGGPQAVPASVAPVASSAGEVIAPIPGLILEIKVRQGDRVSAGQIVATMEAMKMENNLTAPMSGTVHEIRVQKGTEVSTGEIIMRIG